MTDMDAQNLVVKNATKILITEIAAATRMTCLWTGKSYTFLLLFFKTTTKALTHYWWAAGADMVTWLIKNNMLLQKVNQLVTDNLRLFFITAHLPSILFFT